MDSKIVQALELEGIGQVEIRRRRGQKSTTLRVSKAGKVVLSTNYSTPIYSLKKFALMNRDWLDDVRSKSGFFDDIEVFDGQILCPGLKFEIVEKLDLLPGQFEYKYKKGSECILIYSSGSQDSVLLNEAQRNELEPLVIKAVRERARLLLLARLRAVASLMGAHYEGVTIRNTSSRWGSCSSRNDINLSLWLMLLPQDLIDYVLIHELAHTKFKHHGKSFWDEVSKWEPNHKAMRAKLKKHSGQIWW